MAPADGATGTAFLLFKCACAAYAVAWPVYLAGLVSRDLWISVLSRIAWAGWFAHTAGIVALWSQAGAWSPGATLSWALGGAYLAAEFRDRAREAGALVLPALIMGLAVALLAPSAPAAPADPAFASAWLQAHLVLGAFAVGCFAVAGVSGVFLFLGDRITPDSVLLGGSAFGAIAVLASGGEAFAKSIFTGPVLWGSPTAGWIAASAVAFFALHAVGELVAASLVGRGLLRWIFGGGLVSFGALVPALAVAAWRGSFDPSEARFRIAALIAGAAAVGLAAVVARGHAGFRERSADAEAWGLRAYRAVLIGFAASTAALFLWCAWSHFMRGRYWDWSERQIWLVAVWVYYALYLHLRAVEGTRLRTAAAVVVLGLALLVRAGGELWRVSI